MERKGKTSKGRWFKVIRDPVPAGGDRITIDIEGLGPILIKEECGYLGFEESYESKRSVFLSYEARTVPVEMLKVDELDGSPGSPPLLHIHWVTFPQGFSENQVYTYLLFSGTNWGELLLKGEVTKFFKNYYPGWKTGDYSLEYKGNRLAVIQHHLNHTLIGELTKEYLVTEQEEHCLYKVTDDGLKLLKTRECRRGQKGKDISAIYKKLETLPWSNVKETAAEGN